MASEGVPLQHVSYKTWFLRVSVHCEGCKKKVMKILYQVPGVHSVDIDIRQQRAIVIGNVEADTLITKLSKSGKNAELWPEQPMQKEKKPPGKSKTKEKQPEDHHQKTSKNQEIAQVKIQQPGGKKKEAKPPAEKSEALKQKPTKKSKKEIVDFDVNIKQKSKDNDGGADAATATVEFNCKDIGRDHHDKKQSKSKGEKVEDCVANPQPPSKGEKNGGERGNICGGEKSGGGGYGGDESGKVTKNKKGKGQNREEITNGGNGGDESDKIVTTRKNKGQNGMESSGGGGGDGGKIVKKNNSKGQRGNSIHEAADLKSKNHHSDAPSNSSISATERATHHNGYHCHPPYGSNQYGPSPSPSYGVSYNTAYPTNTTTTSYYAPSPPPNTYLYSFRGTQAYPLPPPLDQEMYPLQWSDSFEMFSDENPNGCLVM